MDNYKPEIISIERLYEFYVDTLQRSGTWLLVESDEILAYNLFEEFEPGAQSFLYYESLDKLFAAELITEEEKQKCTLLRQMKIDLEKNDLLGEEEIVRKSAEWRKLLELADTINLRNDDKIKYTILLVLLLFYFVVKVFK